MYGSRLKDFAKAGIDQREGRAGLIDQALKQMGQPELVSLPTVSSSTGAAVTAVIRTR
ncbi:MAG: hypothetical protein HYS17_09155 [Micavibrio aeruginosavorus]|uniref:Uncharacterized protein n=1 Tax=Micavibrio aeruginosavorus TaxID=349221 RepID=A0A7T5UH71_9BACT|nr:MAG: hypothetical protein HYS17_09155 [Micavibrio aeruginosavorus]